LSDLFDITDDRDDEDDVITSAATQESLVFTGFSLVILLINDLIGVVFRSGSTCLISEGDGGGISSSQ
jgi:hypothetical protein